MANITLPGNGEIIATHDNPSGNDVQDLVLVRSDALGTPITADASGLTIQTFIWDCVAFGEGVPAEQWVLHRSLVEARKPFRDFVVR